MHQTSSHGHWAPCVCWFSLSQPLRWSLQGVFSLREPCAWMQGCWMRLHGLQSQPCNEFTLAMPKRLWNMKLNTKLEPTYVSSPKHTASLKTKPANLKSGWVETRPGKSWGSVFQHWAEGHCTGRERESQKEILKWSYSIIFIAFLQGSSILHSPLGAERVKFFLNDCL